MHSAPYLDSTILMRRVCCSVRCPQRIRQLKTVAPRGRLDIITPLSKNAGVAQLVEHHLAKVDVASSSLVTRSSLRLECSAKRRLERVRRSFSNRHFL
jgi:hypothetical protein